jgi:hypothetical protein
MIENWYNLGTYKEIKCRNCGKEQHDVQAMDHHSTTCPSCKIECIWYDMGEGKVLQVIPSLASLEFRMFIEWSQKELDELEFLELIVTFEELGKVIKTK